MTHPCPALAAKVLAAELLAILAVACVLAGPTDAAETEKPNIVFIFG